MTNNTLRTRALALIVAAGIGLPLMAAAAPAFAEVPTKATAISAGANLEGFYKRSHGSHFTVWNKTDESGSPKNIDIYTTANGSASGQEGFRQTLKPGENWVGFGKNDNSYDARVIIKVDGKTVGMAGVSWAQYNDGVDGHAYDAGHVYSQHRDAGTKENGMEEDTRWTDTEQSLRWHRDSDDAAGPARFDVAILDA